MILDAWPSNVDNGRRLSGGAETSASFWDIRTRDLYVTQFSFGQSQAHASSLKAYERNAITRLSYTASFFCPKKTWENGFWLMPKTPPLRRPKVRAYF